MSEHEERMKILQEFFEQKDFPSAEKIIANSIAELAEYRRKIASGEMVEVVRCCECMYALLNSMDEQNADGMHCFHPYKHIPVDFTDYCSLGKRRIDHDE